MVSLIYCSTPLSADSVILPLGADLQSIIDKEDKNTRYVLQSGVHRGHEIILKDGDSLIGEPGAILSGAELLKSWRYEAPYWVHDWPHSKLIPYLDDESRVWEQRANYPHDLFVMMCHSCREWGFLNFYLLVSIGFMITKTTGYTLDLILLTIRWS